MAIGLITYDDSTRREDLTDILTNLSPQRTPLLNGLQRGPDAQGFLHEFLEDRIPGPADLATNEAAGFSVSDHTAPERLNNVVMTFSKDIQVSSDEVDADQAGTSDAFTYQIQKGLTHLANSVEESIVRSSRASGSSGTARRMDGIIQSISTNSTSRNSGSSLGEETFNDIMEMVKGETDEVPDEVYVNSTLKRDISNFSGNSNTRLQIDADDRRLMRAIDTYVSDFGTHKIFWHRDVNNAKDAKELLAIRNETWALSFMEDVGAERLPKESVHRSRAQLTAKLTLEDRYERANAFVDGFTG